MKQKSNYNAESELFNLKKKKYSLGLQIMNFIIKLNIQNSKTQVCKEVKN